MRIALEDELGRTVEHFIDRHGVLGRLRRKDGGDFICLRYIDPWGDTVFNTLQMKPFLAELERLMAHTKSEWELSVLQSILQLARKCDTEIGLYLKFYGD